MLFDNVVFEKQYVLCKYRFNVLVIHNHKMFSMQLISLLNQMSDVAVGFDPISLNNEYFITVLDIANKN